MTEVAIWSIIVIYGLAMLATGWHIGRKEQ